MARPEVLKIVQVFEVFFIPITSPSSPDSPSKAAKPNLARTGPVGTVLNPEILITGETPFTATTEKPSKRLILRLG